MRLGRLVRGAGFLEVAAAAVDGVKSSSEFVKKKMDRRRLRGGATTSHPDADSGPAGAPHYKTLIWNISSKNGSNVKRKIFINLFVSS